MAAPTMSSSRYELPRIGPIDFSLTAGTNIPAPPVSPPPSPKASPRASPTTPRSVHSLARPPTPGGGPLSSHPTSPIDMLAFAYPPTPLDDIKALSPTYSNASTTQSQYHYPYQERLAPSSPTLSHAPRFPDEPVHRRPSSVRRFLGLRSLTSSHAASTDSLTSSSDSSYYNASSNSTVSSSNSNSNYGKRPSSPPNPPSFASPSSTTSIASRPSSALRKRNSASWFRRKSGIFVGSPVEGTLEVVSETHNHHRNSSSNTDNRGSDKLSYDTGLAQGMLGGVNSRRQSLYGPGLLDVRRQPPPMLPEFKPLGCGALGGGRLGEGDIFRDIN
ncbi:hypothetical protein BJ546DRAFT_1060478 [Cryomyces antarcticus]